MTFEDSLKQAGEEIIEVIRKKAVDNFNYGSGLPIAGRITDRSGRLLDSILGTTGESIKDIRISGDTAQFTIGTKTPYAALQEKGGTRPVTSAMRRFFWAKYFEASKIGSPLLSMWSALRFKNIITYPARPYLSNAVNEAVVEIPAILERYTMKYLTLTILETISEYKK